jgi:hypothetical protein
LLGKDAQKSFRKNSDSPLVDASKKIEKLTALSNTLITLSARPPVKSPAA